MIIVDANLDQRTDWTLETGPGVNPVPADAFLDAHLDDGSYRITNSSSQKWGGALRTNKRKVQMMAGSSMASVTYVGMDLLFWIDKADFSWLWAHETDLKTCVQGAPNASTRIPNVFNLSAQVNMSKGGMFQIDANPGKVGWVDTGIKIPPEPATWNVLQLRYKMDIAGATFSVLSVNGQDIDPSQQNMPLQVTNWQPVSAVQLQNEVSKPGVLNIRYRYVTLIYSDEPIPATGNVGEYDFIGSDQDAAPEGGGEPFGGNGLGDIPKL